MPFLRTLALALALSAGSAQASVVTYEFFSGPMTGPSGTMSGISTQVSIDQSLLPVSLPSSTLSFVIFGEAEPYVTGILMQKGGLFYDYSGGYGSFDSAAIVPLRSEDCLLECRYIIRFDWQGEVSDFYYFFDAGPGGAGSMSTSTLFTRRVGSSFSEESFSGDGAYFSTSRRPAVVRTGEVLGPFGEPPAPIPVPASGILLLTALFSLRLRKSIQGRLRPAPPDRGLFLSRGSQGAEQGAGGA